MAEPTLSDGSPQQRHRLPLVLSRTHRGRGDLPVVRRDPHGGGGARPAGGHRRRRDQHPPRRRRPARATDSCPGSAANTQRRRRRRQTDAHAIAPPDPEVQREILRLELEAEVANLQAEADALLSEAVAEGRVIEVPEELRQFASIEATDEAAATRRQGSGDGPADDAPAGTDTAAANEASTEDRAPADGPATRLNGAPRQFAEAPRLSCRRCPTDCRRPARRSSASSPSGSPTATLRPGWPSVRGTRRLVAGHRVGRRRRGRGQLPRRRARRRPATRPAPRPRLGPGVSGALSGLILEDGGRLQMRLGLIAPPDDPARPWRVAAGAPGGLPVRACAGRGDAPERARRDRADRASAEPSRGSTGPDRTAAGRLARQCATCSTTSWTSCASARRPRAARSRSRPRPKAPRTALA